MLCSLGKYYFVRDSTAQRTRFGKSKNLRFSVICVERVRKRFSTAGEKKKEKKNKNVQCINITVQRCQGLFGTGDIILLKCRRWRDGRTTVGLTSSYIFIGVKRWRKNRLIVSTAEVKSPSD